MLCRDDFQIRASSVLNVGEDRNVFNETQKSLQGAAIVWIFIIDPSFNAIQVKNSHVIFAIKLHYIERSILLNV